MSALIFVALAGAWAVYLVPKALKQQEDADAVRSVESFSDRLRVLDPRKAPAPPVVEEVATPDVVDVEEDEYVLEPVRLTKVQLRLRRAAARRAAERRRRVLGTLVLVLAAVVVAAIAGSIAKIWIAAPVVLIAAWLVTCRLMVKKETASRTRMVKKRRTTLADEALAEEIVVEDEIVAPVADNTEEIPAVGPASAATWEPVPVTLPTYVDKAAAARTVRTIDLDSTGVWSSGRNAGDSDLAREAEASRRSEKQAAEAAAEKRRSS
ncbi:divisome protein SepX/GlpR [Nocardioides ultimimeridianus]